MTATLKTIVQENLRRLLGVDSVSVTDLIKLGFGNGTAQRLLDGTTMPRIDTLETLAKALNVTPWQLCVPDLDPNQLPQIKPTAFR